MNRFHPSLLLIALVGLMPGFARAERATVALGRDYVFQNPIPGFPSKLSDVRGLEINSFTTSDGVKLKYWEAGTGEPLIFVPGWSGNGAQYFNLVHLLSRRYHVYVLDQRNQGLSQRVEYGGRISRFAVDLKEFSDHIGVKKANYVGWSMGASVIWSYVDLFGTSRINKAAFVDEPISIYTHDDWTETERLNAGGTTTSPERMVAGFTAGGPLNRLITDLLPLERSMAKDSPYFVNSEGFANTVVKNDPQAMGRVLFDHITNDWRDVVQHKIDVPVAIFSGELSNNLPSQRWMQKAIPKATLYVYTAKQQGDHFLMFKNPLKFTHDLQGFLEH